MKLMRGTALSGTIWGPAKIGRDIGGGGGGGPRRPGKNYSDILAQVHTRGRRLRLRYRGVQDIQGKITVNVKH